MAEMLYQIPLNDAFRSGDECPFCYVERAVEQDLIDYVLGSCASYMERDMRDITDRKGFCRMHFKKMNDYGNTLGNAWILKTHFMRINGELEDVIRKQKHIRISLKDRLRPSSERKTPIGVWAAEKERSCYICEEFDKTFDRYVETFFHMYKNDPKFPDAVRACKGFCIPHFGRLMEEAEFKIPAQMRDEFYETMTGLMMEHMQRLQEDVTWLVNKFDYTYADADWKNSRDANPRGMQKLKGGHPADPPYSRDK